MEAMAGGVELQDVQNQAVNCINDRKSDTGAQQPIFRRKAGPQAGRITLSYDDLWKGGYQVFVNLQQPLDETVMKSQFFDRRRPIEQIP